MKAWRSVLIVYVVLFLAFQLAPLIVVVGASLEHQELLRFPPHGVSLRWYGEILHNPEFVRAGWNSFIVAIFACIGSLVLGAPAAYGIVRYRFPGQAAIAGFLMSPLIVPQLVIGIALLQLFALLGLAASIMTLSLGHILITLPYVVRTLSANIVGLDPSLEEAAAGLGAGRLRIYGSIVLPLVRSGLIASMVFAFLISFDNAVISFFLVSARTTTLPIAIYTYVENSLDPAIAALASLLMLGSMALMLVASRFSGVDRVET